MDMTPELYAKVKGALASDPDFEAAMLRDAGGALVSRFGVALPQPTRLSRDGDGYALTVGDRTYAVTDPRKAAPGELDDAELELLSGGDGNGGGSSTPSQGSVLGQNIVSPGANL